MAAKAEARLGRPVKVMRFDELSEVETYDAVWANASLLHVPRGALGDVLALVFAALKPNGLHFASYKAGGVAADRGLYTGAIGYISDCGNVDIILRLTTIAITKSNGAAWR